MVQSLDLPVLADPGRQLLRGGLAGDRVDGGMVAIRHVLPESGRLRRVTRRACAACVKAAPLHAHRANYPPHHWSERSLSHYTEASLSDKQRSTCVSRCAGIPRAMLATCISCMGCAPTNEGIFGPVVAATAQGARSRHVATRYIV